MAKFKKSAGKKSKRASSEGAQAQAERLSKSLSESAQQIWLAGVGALGRAQAEGTRLFEGLAKDGLNLEETARKFAGNRAEEVRDSVESTVGHARERAADTWDRLEKVFEDRVQRALLKLGVPNREDLQELSRRVDTLTAELRRQGNAGAGRDTSPGRTAARKVTAGRSSTSSSQGPAGSKSAHKIPTRRVAPRSTRASDEKAATPTVKKAGKPAGKTARKSSGKSGGKAASRRSIAPTPAPVTP